jgi:hypothetical protein
MSDVIERIREKCRRDGWYGPENEGPLYLRISEDDPRRSGFVWPPASERQVRTSERRLHFPLPPLLRTLYERFANGGFGPAYGLRGVIGGYAPWETILDRYRAKTTGGKVQLLELKALADWESNAQAFWEFPWTQWPAQLVPICNWGCGSELCLDCTRPSAQVFMVSPSPQDDHLIITRTASSLEAWLEQWLEAHSR